MTRVRAIVALAAAALVVAAAWAVTRPADGGLDLSTRPQTVFETIPLPVGSSYTLGSMAIPPEVPRPLRVTSVAVLVRSGVDVAGVVVGRGDGVSIGLLPIWPPTSGTWSDPSAPDTSYSGTVEIAVGLTTRTDRSGVRGIEVSWTDATGAAGRRMFDLATVTCAPDSCVVPSDDIDGFLREMGLER